MPTSEFLITVDGNVNAKPMTVEQKSSMLLMLSDQKCFNLK